jgi:hypothetical protein
MSLARFETAISAVGMAALLAISVMMGGVLATIGG